ncbi:major facilitator superfamily MFS-1 [Obba rivulosa]|uniref:Major facilitator superfamily MFS-1 n=1 Tax=Obba rivulosa TaxID=1052685 RepID=A0A8E2AMB2_9APHY|nr:major facilitator superfamily MFS-1 [Obba rivulosa]
MSEPHLIHSRLPKRTFGTDESALDVEDESSRSPRAPRATGRASASRNSARPSFIRRWRGVTDEENGEAQFPIPDKPAIPSALQPAGEVYATPLPVLSMIVLSITMLGEFLSANVSAPFLLFMVEGFGQFSDEANVGYWTGILAATFFLTQFLTSLLWATIAAKHGQRIVISISLLGSAVTCLLFGTSTSMQQAIAIRLMQGIFAGAIGVARGGVTFITDQSNEGRAYAILGFCWGFGGVAGAIVGGTFESPAQKWPSIFAQIPLFVEYPYLLPCAVASSVTLIGSVLSLFLGPDCGPREGAIRLPVEKVPTISEETSIPGTPLLENSEQGFRQSTLTSRLSQKLSGYFSRRPNDTQPTSSESGIPEPPVPMHTTPSRLGKARTYSQTSRANGSAYGYGSAYRHRLSSAATTRASTAMSFRRRRESNMDVPQSSVGTDSGLNFAQRLLMANENAVTNIADLWVAAAMNVDNEDPFESDSEYDEDAAELEDSATIDDGDVFGSTSAATAPIHSNRFSRRESVATARHSGTHRPSFSGLRGSSVIGSPRRPSMSHRFSSGRFDPIDHAAGDLSARRSSGVVPSIFSHVGVRTPPAVLEAQQLLAQVEEPSDTLAPIMESRRQSQGRVSQADEIVIEKEPSLWSQLPIIIIFQYGWLALHATTHDQVFYLYLVSKYPSGGLNLNAGHFSQLIALMCLAQIAYQFYLYPNIGPPRGRFSHMAMFRIGSMLFIPSYLSVILYRVFASPTADGNPILMAALALSTAVRFCGGTFSYTAISVLLNYMSPPHLVGFANGIAQSIVSLARFLGPIVGGTLWATSVKNDPSGYPLGFIICAIACALAVAQSFLIR